jgi:hypothetical protein
MSFHGLGIFRISHAKQATGAAAAATVEAQMYCESISFS